MVETFTMPRSRSANLLLGMAVAAVVIVAILVLVVWCCGDPLPQAITSPATLSVLQRGDWQNAFLTCNGTAQLRTILKTSPRVLVVLYAEWCQMCKLALPSFARSVTGDTPPVVLVSDAVLTQAQQEGVEEVLGIAPAYPSFYYFVAGERQGGQQGYDPTAVTALWN